MKGQGSRLAGTSNLHKREKNDFYATDPKSVKALLDVANIRGESFYEPCCGQGHISKVLKKHYPKSRHYASDLIDREYGTGYVDFLKVGTFFGKSKFDWIITNPPFKHAQEFVEKSLSMTNTGVAMFLKIQFLEGQTRQQFLKDTPLKYVYVFSARQNPWRNGIEINPDTGKRWEGTMCFAWFVWKHGYKGEPKVRWL